MIRLFLILFLSSMLPRIIPTRTQKRQRFLLRAGVNRDNARKLAVVVIASSYVMGDARISLVINFTLDDGSVIVAWHSVTTLAHIHTSVLARTEVNFPYDLDRQRRHNSGIDIYRLIAI